MDISYAKKGYSIKEISNSDEYQETDEELILLSSTPKDVTQAKESGFLHVPERVTYGRTTAPFEAVVKQLGKNKRKKIKKAEKEPLAWSVEENNIPSFKEWYEHLYIPAMQEKEHGKIICEANYPETKKEECKKYGLFARKEGKIVAGILFRTFEESQLPRRLSISYVAIHTEERTSGVNELLNAKAIALAHEKGFSHIFRGQDTNIYGKHLAPGLSLFKCAMGFSVYPLGEQLWIKLNNLSAFIFPVMLFAFEEELTAHLFINDPEQEKPFLNKGFPVVIHR